MASIQYIRFEPWREVVTNDEVSWVRDKLARRIEGLPQIFWESGEGWAEANHWALEKSSNRRTSLDTVKAQMKHLFAYANFLERIELDWRHFPIRVADRSIARFRGELIDQINKGNLASSTARARMGSVIQFYRHAEINGFVTTKSPMWREKSVSFECYSTRKGPARWPRCKPRTNQKRLCLALQGLRERTVITRSRFLCQGRSDIQSDPERLMGRRPAYAAVGVQAR